MLRQPTALIGGRPGYDLLFKSRPGIQEDVPYRGLLGARTKVSARTVGQDMGKTAVAPRDLLCYCTLPI